MILLDKNQILNNPIELPLENFSELNPFLSLTSNGVTLPTEKTGKTPLDYIPCVSEAFKELRRVRVTTGEYNSC